MKIVQARAMMPKYGQGFGALVAASREPVEMEAVKRKWRVVFMRQVLINRSAVLIVACLGVVFLQRLGA
jgi:hypothetical protein